MSIIEKLTEGIVNRDMAQEGEALLNKWSSTGLLEGLQSEHDKHNMSRLLENQAKSLLKEISTMAAGDVQGFAAVAFPIVRRVFAGLIANDLVSVQPMSLPSGLIFFLDFTYNTSRLSETADTSIYGQGRVGSQIISGALLNSEQIDHQPYALASAYSSPTSSYSLKNYTATSPSKRPDGITIPAPEGYVDGTEIVGSIMGDGNNGGALRYDPDLKSEYSSSYVLQLSVAKTDFSQFNEDDYTQNVVDKITKGGVHYTVSSAAFADTTGLLQIKRLTREDPNDADKVLFTFLSASAANGTWTVREGSFPIRDNIANVGANSLGAVQGVADWGLEAQNNIPEIDIKVDSVAITASTKKLKAKWTPELGQDLNAYHNLDAEVELTSILSEQIALEIDREILQDLIKGAQAGTYYWSRSPGLFVDRTSGLEIGASAAAPDFTGTVSEWYETLIETINDVSAQIHRKTLRGAANFVVVSPEVANILEFTAGFRANVTADADKGDIGAVKVGSLNRKFDVVVDPYFPRNAVLVGRKGSSFLESGYVYAPYVPLQTTPTIFGPEDFVPRKGVMTRYGKKMVRPDMYGLVIVRGLLGESGATS